MIGTILTAATLLQAPRPGLTVTITRVVQGVRPIALAPAPTGPRFAASLENRSIRIMDAATRQTIREMSGHPQPAYALAYSPDGKLIASGDESGRILFWNAATGAKVREIRPHTRGVQNLSFSRDGKRLLSTGKDDMVIVLNVADGKEVRKIAGRGANLFSATYLPGQDGYIVGTLGQGGRVVTGNTLNLRGHQDESIFDVDANAPSRRFLSAGRDGTAILWDAQGRRIQTLRGHGDFVLRVRFTPNGRYAITSSSDRTVRVWDLRTFKPVTVLENQSAVGSPLAVTADGNFLITANLDDFLEIYRLAPSQAPAQSSSRPAPRRRRGG